MANQLLGKIQFKRICSLIIFFLLTINVRSQVIRLTSQETFWLDANNCGNGEGPLGAWLSFTITNNTSNVLNNVAATFTGFTGANASFFKPPVDNIRNFSSMAIGEKVAVYYYVDYSEVCNHSAGGGNPYSGYTANYILTVSSTGNSNVTRSSSVNTNNLLSANAAGIAVSAVLSHSSIYIGQSFTQTVQYSYGNNTDLFMQPNCEKNFPEDKLRLVGSEVIATTGGVTGILGTRDSLAYPLASVPGGGGSITVRYRWESIGLNSSWTLRPWAAAKSGNKYKYAGLGSSSLFPAAQIGVTINKTANPGLINTPTSNAGFGPGITEWIIGIQNTTNVNLFVNKITDSLPSCMKISTPLVAGSDITALNSSNIPTVGATGNVVWAGFDSAKISLMQYTIPANTTYNLRYRTDVSTCSFPSVYINEAYANYGNYWSSSAFDTLTVGCPSPNITYTGSPFCSRGKASVNLNGNVGGVYTSAPVGLNLNSSTGEINLAMSSAGNYTVTYTVVYSSCTTSANTIVVIKPTPLINLSSTNVTCFGGNNGSANALASNGLSPYSFQWSTSPARTTSGITGLNAGKYIITVTDADNCSSSDSVNITQPNAVLVTTNLVSNVSCAGLLDGAIDINVSGGNNLTYSFEWTKNGGGFSAGTEDLSGLATGIYYVKVSDSQGCLGFDTIDISQPAPLVVSVVSTTNVACNELNSGSVEVSVSGASGSLLYAWTKIGDAVFNENTQNINQLNVGSYQVIVTNSSGCKDTANAVISNSGVTSIFTATQLNCNGEYQLVNNSTGADDFVWDIQGISPVGLNRSVYCTTSDTNFVYSFAPGTYRITLTANSYNGCIDSMSTTLNVVAKPLAVFNFNKVSCSNQINFINLSINGANAAWNFGDPASGLDNTSSLLNVSHVFSTSGTFPVTLISSDAAGCADTITKNITVMPVGIQPQANFSSEVLPQSCVTKVSFTNTSNNATSYTWIFPDGSSNGLANPIKAFPLSGTFAIKLIATSSLGCTDTVSYNVVINNNTYGSVAKFAANEAIQCLAGNKFNFINQSVYYGAGYISNYIWDFGDGTSNTTNTFVYDKNYASPGVYNVKLIAISPNGCSDTTYQEIRVKPSADPNFMASIGCSKKAILIHAVDTNATYIWNFGDGNFAAIQQDTISHEYDNLGLYNITLTTHLENGCSDSYSVSVVAADNLTPVSNFSYHLACGNNIQFENLSQSGSSYLWNFGDGAQVNSGYAPYHSFSNAGSYDVTLTVYNSPTCFHTTTLPVIAPAGWNIKIPVAKMAFHVQPGTNSILARDSGSMDATSFKWFLNNSYVGIGNNINIPTTTAGTYELMMVASNQYCSDTTIAGIRIQDAPEALFEVATNACSNSIMVSSNSKNAISFEWNFGELSSPFNTKYGQFASHTYASNGTYNIRLIAYNAAGFSDTLILPVTVTNNSVKNQAKFTYNNGLCNCKCQNLVRFKNLTPGVNTYLWSFGDGLTSVLANPSKGYPAAGAYQVTLTSVDGNGCMTTQTQTVDIDPTVSGPSASFTTDNQVQCIDKNTFNFFNNSTYMGQGWINKYYWYFGDGTMDSSNSFIFNKKYTLAGNYIVTLVAVGAEGCKDTMSMYIQVRDLPCSGNMKFVNLQDGSNWNIDPKLSDIGVSNSVQGIEKNWEYSIYPNPNEGKFSIHFRDHIKHPFAIAVYDMLGKEVYHHTFNDLGSMAIDLNFESLSNGTYYLQINSEHFQFTDKKFIIIHQ